MFWARKGITVKSSQNKVRPHLAVLSTEVDSVPALMRKFSPHGITIGSKYYFS